MLLSLFRLGGSSKDVLSYTPSLLARNFKYLLKGFIYGILWHLLLTFF